MILFSILTDENLTLKASKYFTKNFIVSCVLYRVALSLQKLGVENDVVDEFTWFMEVDLTRRSLRSFEWQ